MIPIIHPFLISVWWYHMVWLLSLYILAVFYKAADAGGGCLDIFFSHLSFLSSFSLFLGDNSIYTEKLSQRAVKPKTTNQPSTKQLLKFGGTTFSILLLINNKCLLLQKWHRMHNLAKTLNKRAWFDKGAIPAERHSLLVQKKSGKRDLFTKKITAERS